MENLDEKSYRVTRITPLVASEMLRDASVNVSSNPRLFHILEILGRVYLDSLIEHCLEDKIYSFVLEGMAAQRDFERYGV